MELATEDMQTYLTDCCIKRRVLSLPSIRRTLTPPTEIYAVYWPPLHLKVNVANSNNNNNNNVKAKVIPVTTAATGTISKSPDNT